MAGSDEGSAGGVDARRSIRLISAYSLSPQGEGSAGAVLGHAGRGEKDGYSAALMSASRITLVHLAISARMVASNSSAEPPPAVMPSAARRFCTSAWAS